MATSLDVYSYQVQHHNLLPLIRVACTACKVSLHPAAMMRGTGDEAVLQMHCLPFRIAPVAAIPALFTRTSRLPPTSAATLTRSSLFSRSACSEKSQLNSNLVSCNAGTQRCKTIDSTGTSVLSDGVTLICHRPQPLTTSLCQVTCIMDTSGLPSSLHFSATPDNFSSSLATMYKRAPA